MIVDCRLSSTDDKSTVMEAVQIHPGAWHLRGYLTLAEQRQVLDRCLQIAEGPAGFYVPTVRGGRKMSVGMLCLGLHWNALTYTYEQVRSDYDGQPAPTLTSDLAALARRAAAAVGMSLEPQVCIINRYGPASKLGLHQDRDEGPETIDAGIPIVSLSLGATARFLLGGTRRKEGTIALALSSGDGFVMGGPSRLRYHGVANIVPRSGPPSLSIDDRLSLTFRQHSL